MHRSRLLTTLGWVHVAMGAYVPARLLLTYTGIWGTLHVLQSWRVSPFIVDLVEPVMIGLLSGTAGILLLRRHRWAPGGAFFAGGVILIDAAFNFWIWGRMDLALMLQTLPTEKYWRIIVSRIVELSLDLGRILCWLATLGIVYTRTSREEFPATHPSTTSTTLLLWLGASAFVESVVKAWIMAVWWVRS